jgi:hypothetical protein
MISQLEFSARAALCRQLANQEPANRALWMAEAENWLRLRLSLERLRGEAGQKSVPTSWQVCGRGRQDAYQFRRRQESHEKIRPMPTGVARQVPAL